MKKRALLILGLILSLSAPAHADFFDSKGRLIESITSTATAAGTTTLTYQSNRHQRFTGSTTQTVALPSGTSMRNGTPFIIENDSTGVVTVNNNGGSLVSAVPAGRTYTFLLTDNGTSDGTWTVNKAVGAGTLVNADVDASAAIARSKLGTGTADHVVINSGAGAFSSESSLAISRGGTGQATATLGFNALDPLTTKGDLIGYNGTDSVRCGVGSNGQILEANSAATCGFNWVAASSTALAVAAKTTTYTATTSDNVLTADASGGAFTITLYSASGNTGRTLDILKTDSSSAAVTVDGDGSETIRGATTFKLSTQYERLRVVSDGTNWQVLGHEYPKLWKTFTPTGSWVAGTETYTGVYRRVGDSLEFRVKIALSGAPTSTSLQINLPSGLEIDTAKLVQTSGGTGTLGIGTAFNSGVSFHELSVNYTSTTAVAIYISNSASTHVTSAQVTQAIPFTWGNADAVDILCLVPISGWEG